MHTRAGSCFKQWHLVIQLSYSNKRKSNITSQYTDTGELRAAPAAVSAD